MDKYFVVVLSLILFLLSFTVFATKSKDEYLVPYIEMFNQYVEESGTDAYIGDIDLFYDVCKDLSLSEWEDRLDEMFEEVKTITEQEEPIDIELKNSSLPRSYDDIFGDATPGISTNQNNFAQ